MSDQRDGGIAWTDQTWNPVRGCSRVSPGCENCYAERVAARFSGKGQPYEGLANMTARGPRWTREVRLVEDHLEDPLRWRRPRRIFVNSMSDLFHEGLSNESIARVFAIMASATAHTFQVLTKRALRMHAWFEWVALGPNHPREIIGACSANHGGPDVPGGGWPLPNVWLGVSVEDQQRADERIPILLQTPAAVRFISAEPLLGPVDLRSIPYLGAPNGRTSYRPGKGLSLDVLAGRFSDMPGTDERRDVPFALGLGMMSPIDWIIVGAESGPGFRPMEQAWVRSLRDQARAAGTAFFYKQAIVDGKKVQLPVLDDVQHAEFPA